MDTNSSRASSRTTGAASLTTSPTSGSASLTTASGSGHSHSPGSGHSFPAASGRSFATVATRPPSPRGPLVALVLAVTVLLAALLSFGQGQPAAPLTGAAVPLTSAAVPDHGPPHLAVAWTDGARFHWPLIRPHPVLRRFQRPRTPYGPGHRGVDLGGQVGEPVLAAGSGLVLYAGPLADRSLVSIEHAGGLRTTYEPVRPTVRVGQYVQRGQVIGLLMAGHPGCPAVAPMVCLHWGAHRGRVYLDPLRLVEAGHVRLLPWAGAP